MKEHEMHQTTHEKQENIFFVLHSPDAVQYREFKLQTHMLCNMLEFTNILFLKSVWGPGVSLGNHRDLDYNYMSCGPPGCMSWPTPKSI